MSRLKKFKTNKKLTILIKLCIVFYVSIAMIGYLVSGTGAYFNDVNSEKQVIQAGTWWDGSELEFVKNNTENIKGCPPATITVKIKNVGNSMMGPTKYEIYYGETGEPKSNGVKIAEGQIKALNAGETIELSYEAKRIGSYMFKALQTPGYNDNYEERHGEWSNKLMVKCLENNPQNGQKEIGNTQIKTEESSKTTVEKETTKSEDSKQEHVKDESTGTTEEKPEADSNVEKETATEEAEEDKKEHTTEEEKIVTNEPKEVSSDTGNSTSSNASQEEKAVIGDDEDGTLKEVK